MITAKADVVIVLIASDGTVSTIGPFLSPQRAKGWLRRNPFYSETNGFDVTIDRMDAPE